MPVPIPGKTLNPPYLNDTCHGFFIKDFASNYLVDYKKLYLEWLELLISEYPEKEKIFNPFFDKLAGTDELRKQLSAGKSIEDIRKSWESGLATFMLKRQQYLLYDYDPAAGLLD